MDSRQFDRIARMLATTRSRRGVLGALAAAVTGVAVGPLDASAHHPRHRCVRQNASCARQHDVCCEGLVCSAGRRRCVGNVGASCRTALGCNDGLVCRNGACSEKQVCRAYRESCIGATCCAGLACDAESRACYGRAGYGDDCLEDADCGPRLECDDRYDVCCRATGEPCEYQEDCCSDATCFSGHCLSD